MWAVAVQRSGGPVERAGRSVDNAVYGVGTGIKGGPKISRHEWLLHKRSRDEPVRSLTSAFGRKLASVDLKIEITRD